MGSVLHSQGVHNACTRKDETSKIQLLFNPTPQPWRRTGHITERCACFVMPAWLPVSNAACLACMHAVVLAATAPRASCAPAPRCGWLEWWLMSHLSQVCVRTDPITIAFYTHKTE